MDPFWTRTESIKCLWDFYQTYQRHFDCIDHLVSILLRSSFEKKRHSVGWFRFLDQKTMIASYYHLKLWFLIYHTLLWFILEILIVYDCTQAHWTFQIMSVWIAYFFNNSVLTPFRFFQFYFNKLYKIWNTTHYSFNVV